MQQYLEAGKIVNTFGVRGELKLEPWCDSAEFLLPLKRLFISGEEKKILSSRVHKGMLIIRLEGLDDMNTAMLYKNRMAHFHRDDIPLPEGRYFIADILHSRVIDEAGRDIGELTEVIELPAGQNFVVKGAEEHMIPAVPEFILQIDAENKEIRVHLIEGM